MPQRKNVFVVGLDDANLPTLEAVPDSDSYRFHRLLGIEELQEGEVSVPGLMDRARAVLDAHDGSIDAIVGYWDFPVSTLVPMLGEEYGVRTTSLESVVKCEHKYWSRLEQRKVIDEYPRFGRVDLDADDPKPPEGVGFPMWLKPALAYSSELAFGVSDMTEFRAAVEEIKAGIGRVGRPFDSVLGLLELPPEMEGVGGQVCLAEEAMTGIQVAVEGYVHQGRATVYGVLDSINYPASPCFLRHQYPSSLPAPVIRKLHDVSERTMQQIGMESATFSIEYFYDPRTQDICLLEINPRHSQSHAELFDYVDGAPNHHRMLSLALGRDPALSGGKGPYAVAAKWYFRWFGDGKVHEVPTPERIAAIEREIPGVRIDVVPEEGQKLSTVSQQDSYSYEVAHIFTGGDDEEDLRRKFDRCVAALGLTFDETEPGGHGTTTR
ncbi:MULTISPECIES: acetyl-CoA carboxylase biotin carboxylase subunit family protein [Streptomyces]|uniref:ATP-grasp domain-containing protein n=1 Tax=Streptomyces glycanivorans TaxID=3033808 RepID=A0ABY9J6T7_9ACTN|nr:MULTISPECIES: ATP-grasp domain-containing protein [unclassified Streptomyces]WSQ76100.1 ATP-grasp domain-containing protein [Streptomyces sp. NBC_01213]TXS12449.1 ATP-grasp domain-containing protein [Streptomyces sp. wa22]WLQ62589.1 ATP-grasp domain-containing protein [Streptomyces sp. Alt3]WSQ83346.1 ATP-grasp domain-containing protein [Streptomyces sp. NBC_01212]WSR10622.1 ATP-grasp domain-containing protein [Streptomyces sp. NBC_01208]